MNEAKIHSLIRKELQSQYEKKKGKWLRSQTSFDIEWEPDWEDIRSDTASKVERMDIDGVRVMDYLYDEYGDDCEAVMDGHVFQVFEAMDLEEDLETTKENLRIDGKPPISRDDRMFFHGVRY